MKEEIHELIQSLTNIKNITYTRNKLGNGSYNQIKLIETFEKERAWRYPIIASKDNQTTVDLTDLPTVKTFMHLKDGEKPGWYQKKYDGDLLHFIKNRGRMQGKSEYTGDEKRKILEKNFSNIAYQMITIVNKFHEKNIIHGDIKPENFLYIIRKNEKIEIVLTDLDGCTPVDNGGFLKEGQNNPPFTYSFSSLNLEDPENKKHSDIDAVFLTLLELITNETQGSNEVCWVISGDRKRWIDNKKMFIEENYPEFKDFFESFQAYHLEAILNLPIFDSIKIEENSPKIEKEYYFLEKHKNILPKLGGMLPLYTRSTQDVIVGADALLEESKQESFIEAYDLWGNNIRNSINKEKNKPLLKEKFVFILKKMENIRSKMLSVSDFLFMNDTDKEIENLIADYASMPEEKRNESFIYYSSILTQDNINDLNKKKNQDKMTDRKISQGKLIEQLMAIDEITIDECLTPILGFIINNNKKPSFNYAIFLGEMLDLVNETKKNLELESVTKISAKIKTLNNIHVILNFLKDIRETSNNDLLNILNENKTENLADVLNFLSGKDDGEEKYHCISMLKNLALRKNKSFLLSCANKLEKLKNPTYFLKIEIDQNAKKFNLTKIEHANDIEILSFQSAIYPRIFTPFVIEKFNTINKGNINILEERSEPLHNAEYAKLLDYEIKKNTQESIVSIFMNGIKNKIRNKKLNEHELSLLVVLVNHSNVQLFLDESDEYLKKLFLTKLLDIFPYMSFKAKWNLFEKIDEHHHYLFKRIIESDKKLSNKLKSELKFIKNIFNDDCLSQNENFIFYLYNKSHILDKLDEALPAFVYVYMRQASDIEKKLLVNEICNKLLEKNNPTKHKYYLLASTLDILLKSQNNEKALIIIERMITKGEKGMSKKLIDAIKDIAVHMPPQDRKEYLKKIIEASEMVIPRIKYTTQGVNFFQRIRILREPFKELVQIHELTLTEKNSQEEESLQNLPCHEYLLQGNLAEFRFFLHDRFEGNEDAIHDFLMQLMEDDLHRSMDKINEIPSLLGAGILCSRLTHQPLEEILPEYQHLIKKVTLPGLEPIGKKMEPGLC